MDITLWIELIAFIILMGLSGFFSSSETALFSLSSFQLEQMRREGDPHLGLIERLLSEPRRLIQTILIGNELVNVSASVISAAVVIQLLGAENKFMNLFIMIPILLLVGEITPKTLAIKNNAAFARVQARPIDLFARLMHPIRIVIRYVADWFISLIVGKERSRGNLITEDMVRTLAREAVGEGALDRHEAQLIDQIFEFGDKTVEDVMVPRSSIFYLPVEMSLQEMVVELRRTRHTKIPIYKKHRDTIIGILYARDLLGVDIEQLTKESGGLKQILRKPYFVPETKSAAELFHTFRERKFSFALVVDEYGGVTGLITMEDLLELIFGEIISPAEMGPGKYIRDLGEGRYAVDAATPIVDFNEEVGGTYALPTQWADTIGGLLLHEYGELPPEGADIPLKELHFTVTKVEKNRIITAEVQGLEEPAAAADKPEPAKADEEASAPDKDEREELAVSNVASGEDK